jgi:organic hydroperoxide reductase OsmC/OhrA
MPFVTVRAKELRYAVELTTDGGLRDEKGVGLEVPEGWSAEHLLLAALVRCSLESLGYHARRAGVEIRSASAATRTLVTKRRTDGRYALVETEVELAVTLEPEPEREALAELLAATERDCFVGSSLTAEPTYRWTVNGRTIDS